MSSPTFIDRDFAGETRRFQLPLAAPLRLYRGLEAEGLGTLSEMAQGATSGALGRNRVEVILAHGLSRGHPLTLIRMRELVREEMRERPLADFVELAVAVIAAAYAGAE